MNDAPNALNELRLLGMELSAFRFVQGPGGNVSVKTEADGQPELWVKASGKRLTEVAEPHGHARVSLADARAALRGDTEADKKVFGLTPRPSLETYFHTFGGAVVAHTHALGAMLFACSTDEGSGPFDPAWGVKSVPYVRPGRELAVAIEKVIDPEASEQRVVLRSHGFIAFAPTAARAVAMTLEFDNAVRHAFGHLESAEQLLISYLQQPEQDLVGGGVMRPLPRRAERQPTPRYLFPDAPVCAGKVLSPPWNPERLPDVGGRALTETGRAGVMVDPNGNRVAIAKTSAQLRQTVEVLAAHDWLEDALLSKNKARYLPEDEPAKILNLPSEQYRIRLSSSAG